jgi:hypothetical protein
MGEQIDNKGVLVWLNTPWRVSSPTEEELVTELHLSLLSQAADGRIYWSSSDR